MTYTRTAETVEIDGAVYPTVRDEEGRLRIVETCWKCQGTGIYTGPPEAGTCFPCNGHGHFYPLVSSVKAREARHARAHAKAQAAAAAALAERAEREAPAFRWISANADFLERVSRNQRAGRALDAFLDAVAAIEIPRVDDTVRALEILADLETRGEVPEGRVVLEGEVVSRKRTESPYGVAWKLTIKLANGARVYGTEPSALTADRGDLVRMTATVERSSDDASFGFYKRPTKAEVVGRAAVEAPARVTDADLAAAEGADELELTARVVDVEIAHSTSRAAHGAVRLEGTDVVFRILAPSWMLRRDADLPTVGDVVTFRAKVDGRLHSEGIAAWALTNVRGWKRHGREAER